MRRAAELVRDAGGVEATRVFTRMWLALLSLWSWENVPVLPPEQILLPPRAPLSIYSFGCWARQTIVALSIASALRPAASVPFGIDELRTGAETERRSSRGHASSRSSIAACTATSGGPAQALRRRALKAAERWVVERQEADGSWGGIQPPWVWSIVALHALGYPLDHPVIEKALAGLDSFTIEDEAGRRIEACQSPVWDTALAVLALLDAGFDPGHEAVARGALWLAGREVRVRGDWSVRKPKLEPGGFPFEFANDNYPDVDDTAVVVLALRRAGIDGGGAAERGVAWSLGMQSRDGGWAAFDVDNTSRLPASSRSATSAPSPIRRAPTSPRTWSRCSRTRDSPRAPRRAGVSTGCCASRSPTARGSGAGAPTTSTGRRPSCPRSPRAASPTTRASAPPSTGSSACRTRTAASARTSAPTATGVAGARRVDRIADRVGAARLPRSR